MAEFEDIGEVTVGEFKSFLSEYKKEVILELKKEFDVQDEDYYVRVIGEITLAGSLLVICLIGYAVGNMNGSKMKDIFLFFLKYGVSILCAGSAIAYMLFHMVNLIKAGIEYRDIIKYLEGFVEDEKIIQALESEVIEEDVIKRVLEKKESVRNGKYGNWRV